MPAPRSVLLIMDFQQGNVGRIGGSGVVDAAVRAVAAARAANAPVMFVKVGFRAGYPEIADSNAIFGAAAARADDGLHEDHASASIHSAFAPRPDEPIVVKRRVSAFTGSDLDVLLRAAKADTLVLAGLSTSGVVLATVCEAADLDYRLVVLEDACADPDARVHEVLMSSVFAKRAVVTTVDDWARSLTDSPTDSGGTVG